MTGQAKSYAERMFTFPEIGSLAEDEAAAAVAAPAEAEGVGWDDDAVSLL